MNNTIMYGSIAQSDITLNANEVIARMRGSEETLNQDVVKECEKELMQAVQCKYACARVSVVYPKINIIDLGFGEIRSKALYNNLNGAKEAFIFATTLGIGVDRLLMKTSVLSQTKHFITDAVASAAAESVCNIAEKIIKGSLSCRSRFSPGYSDLSIEIQPNILDMLNAQKLLGISLNKAFLMTPSKSITAIMGICNEQ